MAYHDLTIIIWQLADDIPFLFLAGLNIIELRGR